MRFPSHLDRSTRKARAAYCCHFGSAEAEARRDLEIAALPSKVWKGRTVYRLICQADFGKGPHEMWIPAHVLWSLISLDHYRCIYHL